MKYMDYVQVSDNYGMMHRGTMKTGWYSIPFCIQQRLLWREVLMSEFDYTSTREGEITLVHITKSIDISGASEFNSRIVKEIDSGSRKFILNFRELNHISTTGIGALINCREILSGKNGEIILACINDEIRNKFNLLGIEGLFEIYENVDDAVRELSSK
jgi:anti-sigma B factor antagonist